MVRAVESTRLSDLGRRFRLVTESCLDIGLPLALDLPVYSNTRPPPKMITFVQV
jgi:hypothetical protein